MAGKKNDVIKGSAMLSTGLVEAIVDLKNHTVIVQLDTDHDGTLDAVITGFPAAKGARGASLENMLGNEGIQRASDRVLSPEDVRSLGILARGIDTTNRGNSR